MQRAKEMMAMAAAMLLAACSGEPGQAGAEASSEATADAMPVAVELFTSQGCSSCPPADALIAELADDPGLVVITRPVTYWDRLGWRDTLGREENTALQRVYAATLESGGGRAYTPQAVVSGQIGLVGSRRRELEAAIADARTHRAAVALDIAEAGRDAYLVALDGTFAGTATVRLLALDGTETVPIGRGENAGRTITYTNVVRGERDLGEWRGGTRSFRIGANEIAVPGADRHAIVVRDGAAGPILAVRYLQRPTGP